MMTLALLLLAGSAGAQVALSPTTARSYELSLAEIRRIASPTTDELVARLRGGERAARLAAAGDIGTRLGGFDMAEQHVLVAALREAAETMSTPPEVRAKALVVLGEGTIWLKDDATRREAVEALLDFAAADARDERSGYRRPALKALWMAASRLPQDQALEERTATTLLAYVSGEGPDRTLAMLALRDLIVSRPRLVYGTTGSVSRELESRLLDIASRDPQSLCFDARWDSDARYALVRLMQAYAWAGGAVPARVRVKTFLTGMGQSDPVESLRQLARIYAASIRA